MFNVTLYRNVYICFHNYVNKNQISIVCIILHYYYTIITYVPYNPQYLCQWQNGSGCRMFQVDFTEGMGGVLWFYSKRQTQFFRITRQTCLFQQNSETISSKETQFLCIKWGFLNIWDNSRANYLLLNTAKNEKPQRNIAVWSATIFFGIEFETNFFSEKTQPPQPQCEMVRPLHSLRKLSTV